MRLIDADVFEKRMNKYAKDCREEGDTNTAQVFDDVLCELQEAPTIDPVKHGKWLGVGESQRVQCSVCKSCGTISSSQPTVYRFYKYCPDCGAMMDLEEEDET